MLTMARFHTVSCLLGRVVILAVFCSALPLAAHAADLAKGKTLYHAYCVGCHGARGVSDNPEAPNFARGERLMQPDPDLIDTVRSGINAMPPFIGILSDRDILDVISYARTLQWQ